MRNPPFINNYIYHIYNRGVEKRTVFLDDKDFFRFIHDLFEFNDNNTPQHPYYRQLSEIQLSEIGSLKIKKERQPRKLLVEIMAFCLMPNHFHLLIRQKQDNGISLFMQKLGIGYSMYFNQRYERSGVLFQGKFKAVLVKNESHFFHLPYYIHCNPLDLAAPGWRERDIKDYKKAIRFLEQYRWSSHLDYIGKKNFPSVTQRDFLLKLFGGTEGYRKGITSWLKSMDLERISGLMLE